MDPTFGYLLSLHSSYVSGKEAIELLLNDAFLQSMLKGGRRALRWSTRRRREKRRDPVQRRRTIWNSPLRF